MPLSLLLAPVGTGKTETVAAQIAAVKARDPFAAVWVVRATARQEAAFRTRLIERQPRAAFNVEFFNFYSLYHRVLAMVGIPQRALSEPARIGLLRAIIRAAPLQHYAAIRDLPGFATSTARLIAELKQQRIAPEALTQAAAQLGQPRLTELAAIYTAYQTTLRTKNLVDSEGEGWLALEAVRAHPTLLAEVALLAVDGFDQFNPVQAALIVGLAQSARDALVTLTTVPGREATIGRRFTAALTALETAAGGILPRHRLAVPVTVPSRGHALTTLTEHFGLRGDPPDAAADAAAVVCIEAPDAVQEAAALLRTIKRRLLDGTPPDDILIAVRDWPQYGPPLIDYAQRIGVPTAAQHGEPLAQIPAIAALLHLLTLADGDFRWRDLLDALRSPYFRLAGITPVDADALEALCYTALIVDGRDRWLSAVRAQAVPALAEADDSGEGRAAPALAVRPDLAADLARFFAAVTPPPTGSTAAYVAWLETLIGVDAADLDDSDHDDSADAPKAPYSLHMLACIRMDADGSEADPDPVLQAAISRDLAALDCFMSTLRGLLSAAGLLGSLGFADPVTPWADFRARLNAAVDAAAVFRAADRAGRVLITTVSEARGLPHPHIYIPGLSEGIFPARTPVDPLLLDSERLALAAHGVALPITGDRADDDGLFYELLALAGASITFSRPTVSKGEAQLPSPLWTAARRACPHARLIVHRLGVPPEAATVCLPAEAALTAVYGRSRGDHALTGWLAAESSGLGERIAAAQRVEAARMQPLPAPDRYSGGLESPMLRAWAAQRFGTSARWSASALNALGQCGYQFFAGRVLKLTPFQPPDAAVDVRQRGSILHAILERAYSAIAAAGLPIAPGSVETAAAYGHAAADTVLPTAPQQYRFVASATWDAEAVGLRQQVEHFIRADFSAGSPVWRAGDARQAVERRVLHTELTFGGTDDPPASLLAPDGTAIPLRGSIDRIDVYSAAGIDHYRVIDYKSGTSLITARDVERGTNFQMLVYLDAAAALLGLASDDDRLSGVFASAATRAPIGELTPGQHAAALAAGRAHAARLIALAQAGMFSTVPTQITDDQCSRYCDFAALCRVRIRASDPDPDADSPSAEDAAG